MNILVKVIAAAFFILAGPVGFLVLLFALTGSNNDGTPFLHTTTAEELLYLILVALWMIFCVFAATKWLWED